MPRQLRRLYDTSPDPYDPEWRDYFKERVTSLDVAFMTPDVAPELGWLVEGLLPVGYLTVLAGRPKDGKTCFAAALATAVSRGDDFAGMRTAKNKVLYFAAEESPVEWEWAIRPWLGDLDPTDFRVAHGGFALDHVPDLHALHHKILGESIRLVVVDPLMAATVAGNFNDSRRARHVLGSLKSLCRGRGCTIVVVHHAKERGGRAHRVAENPQLAATASLNLVLNRRDATPEEGAVRVVSLAMSGRGRFANSTLELLSPEPCRFLRLPSSCRCGDEPTNDAG